MKRETIERVMRIPKDMGRHHVGAYAAQAAYFFMLSLIPIILLLLTMVRYTPVTKADVMTAVVQVFPTSVDSLITSIVNQVYNQSSTIIPITVIVALWSAGKGMQSIINGLNTIYHVKETRNWLLTRIYAVFYTLSLVIAVIVSLLMLVLGNEIQKVVSRYIPFLGRVLGKILGARALLVFGVLFLVFLMLYKVLPNRKATFKSQIPGALIIAVAWSIFSYGFSFYFEIFPGFSNMYGNLATIIMVMVWLYICMNLLLYGAEINAYFEKEFRIAHKSVQELLAHEKEKKQQENE